MEDNDEVCLSPKHVHMALALQGIKCTSITSILRKSLTDPLAEYLSTGLVCLVRSVGEEDSRILTSPVSRQFMTQVHRGVPGSTASSDLPMMLITMLTKCLVQSESEATLP